ncbi:hypothetical protein FAZ69_08350 [Trinickia terrae]|uniref:Uncharacterized protein n=1 Tax=Trinickia terrae TaxID=2571161 RepID=A0A4U1I9I2_9BURK|nr:hypothetical protein [Trinickia terrae]TKC90149.1 hypothetical protein FAZ69_08350 [Trinickia terrae]
MYFSTSNSGNQQAAKIVALSAAAFGAELTKDRYAHVPFESVAAAISHAKAIPADQVARELFQLDPERRRKSLSVGLSQMVKAFGNEEQAMAFFRQVREPVATLRFEGVGGISESALQVKNRLAALASDAYLTRQGAAHDGLLPIEREYVDLLKSVRRELTVGVERDVVPPDAAEGIAAGIEGAVRHIPLPGMAEYVAPLHDVAREELFEEARERVRQRYAAKPSFDGPAPE